MSMGKGISEVLTFAVGVASAPTDHRGDPDVVLAASTANGLMFLLGWVLALAVVGGVAYVASDQASPSPDSTTSDTIAWENRLRRPLPPAGRPQLAHPPGTRYRAETPKWIAGIDTLKPGNALGLGLLLAGVNPKNLMLPAAAVSVLRPLGVQVHRKRARQPHPDGMSDRMRRASLTLRPEWLIAVTGFRR